jgi:hypothetical protein
VTHAGRLKMGTTKEDLARERQASVKRQKAKETQRQAPPRPNVMGPIAVGRKARSPEPGRAG